MSESWKQSKKPPPKLIVFYAQGVKMGVRQKMKAIKSLKYKDFMEKRYLNGVQEAGSSNLLTQTTFEETDTFVSVFFYVG